MYWNRPFEWIAVALSYLEVIDIWFFKWLYYWKSTSSLGKLILEDQGTVLEKCFFLKATVSLHDWPHMWPSQFQLDCRIWGREHLWLAYSCTLLSHAASKSHKWPYFNHNNIILENFVPDIYYPGHVLRYLILLV